MDQVLVFDMDGVLVDVSESYRETICATVRHFTGKEITRADIQDLKNQGGWNDDWSVSQHFIRRCGVEIPFQEIVDYFQGIFHGNGADGLILRERWLAREGLFERLCRRFQLAVFTGRMRWEAEFTLKRFAAEICFSPIVGYDDVEKLKPAPDGLLKISSLAPGARIWYIGDTVDDAHAARAAGVPFIGIAAPSNPRYQEVIAVLRGANAIAVLEDINQLESVLP